VYLARIHPIKGAMTLVEAWHDLSDAFPDWELKIAGVDDGSYQEILQKRAKELGTQRLFFMGPLFGNAKTDFLARADLYCLPTTSDNFAITVAEALAHGVPAVTTTAAPWPGLVERNCGWWVPPNQEAIVHALRTAMSMSSRCLEDMGNRGRQWVQKDFDTETMCLKMLKTYEWVLNGGEHPTWVDLVRN
jgi:glycosyltransferase involved in cell wall biosynthesis